MNVSIHAPRPAVHAARPAVAIPPPRPEPRRRDFGIGYGSSSGYVSNRRYASSSVPSRFRFA